MTGTDVTTASPTDAASPAGGPVPLAGTGGRVVTVTAYGGPETLRVTRRPDPPPPGPGEVLVRVDASSATLSDSIVRRGLSPYLGTTEPPFALGYDLVGTVEAVGAGVTGLAPGRRVVDVVRWGGNADLVVRPAGALTPVPVDLDPVLLEPLVMTGITAYQMLHRVAGVQPGQRVLVHGASGGVGLPAADLALQAGAEVIGTASAHKVPVLTARGIRAVDRRDDVVGAVRDLAPGGVDVVIDGAGGAETARVADLLVDGGVLVSYGYASAAAGAPGRSPETLAELGRLMSGAAATMAALAGDRGRRAEFYEVVERRTHLPQEYADDLAVLARLVADGSWTPRAVAVPLAEAVTAHHDLDAGRPVGRLVLDHAATAGASR